MLSEHLNLSITSSSLKESQEDRPQMLKATYFLFFPPPGPLSQVSLGNGSLETCPKVVLNHGSRICSLGTSREAVKAQAVRTLISVVVFTRACGLGWGGVTVVV